jgi:hypothetical protein
VSHQLSEYPLLGDEPRASNTVRFSCFHKAWKSSCRCNQGSGALLSERGYKIAALNSSKYVE